MSPLLLAAGYLIAAGVLLAWSRWPTVADVAVTDKPE
jgi:hypothetical protein